MKDSILICALDSAKWIGGLYYKRNILFSLLQNKFITQNYKIIVMTSKENLIFFKSFKDKIKLITYKQGIWGKFKFYFCQIFYRVKFVYPIHANKIRQMLGITSIEWIADFQHNYYPEFFSGEEIKSRTERYFHIQKSDLPLVLSSNTCKSDFEEFYGHKSNVYVVPFVSYIEPELKQITAELENKTLLKYDILRGKYACISNQFWQHKNHIVVLKAIKRLHSKLGDFKFVFTGYPKDYRNPDYYNLLMEYIQDPEVAPHIKVLGFVERVEQLIVMKNSRFIIQPSLFEGWGTVVEDAKVLDKNMLLSDIPVHREQMNNKCVLFVPHDDEALAAIISDMLNKEYTDDIQVGLKDMYARAKMYSEGFERLLINEGK